VTTAKKKSTWDLESGLPNDVDGWIANPRFGTRDEYAEAVRATGAGEVGIQFLFDIVGEDGEVVGNQGYSIGTGWIPSDDGLTITHAKRKNVVASSRYGQLQHRVVKVLGMDMEARGLPTDAKVWDGLGFHWMLEDMTTVSGKTTQVPMPTEFLSEKKIEAKAAPEIAVPADTDKQLRELAQSNPLKDFQLAAMRIPGVSQNEELMSNVLDEGDAGYWATHK